MLFTDPVRAAHIAHPHTSYPQSGLISSPCVDLNSPIILLLCNQVDTLVGSFQMLHVRQPVEESPNDKPVLNGMRRWVPDVVTQDEMVTDKYADGQGDQDAFEWLGQLALRGAQPTLESPLPQVIGEHAEDKEKQQALYVDVSFASHNEARCIVTASHDAEKSKDDDVV